MKKKSALFVSLSMVLVAVLALTTASFAWFTSSLNPTISNIDIGATTSQALLISAEQSKGFATSLDASALKVAGNILPDWAGTAAPADTRRLKTATPQKGDVAAKGTSLTYVAAKDTAKWDMVTNVYNADNYFADPIETTGLMKNATGDAEKELYFVRFDLYFKASVPLAANEHVEVALDLTSTKTDNGTTTYTGSTVDAKGSVTDTLQKQVDKIVRVAFVTTEANYGAGAAKNDIRIWEPNAGSVENLTGVIAYDKSTNMQYLVTAQNSADSTKFPGNDAHGGNSTAATANMKLFDMTTAATQKVTVYIWLEGNDPESDNLLSGGDFSTLLNFVGEVKTPTPVGP